MEQNLSTKIYFYILMFVYKSYSFVYMYMYIINGITLSMLI